jgi:adenylate cyclase
LDRDLFSYYSILSVAHYGSGDYEEAVKWAKMSRNENPLYTANLRYLSAGLAALDRLDEAQEVAASLMLRDPTFRVSTFERTLLPFRIPEIKEKFAEHLRKAGLPN